MKEQGGALQPTFQEVMRRLTDTPRRRGDCQLCCRLVPVEELRKPANKRCKHQRHAKGCAIYADRPVSCAAWSCGWLAGFAFPRPDHCHYVVDSVTDTIAADRPGEPRQYFDVLQVWVDPAYPDAWRCEQLMRFLEAKRLPAIVRFDERMAFTLWPPCFGDDGAWHRTETAPANAAQGMLAAEQRKAQRP